MMDFDALPAIEFSRDQWHDGEASWLELREVASADRDSLYLFEMAERWARLMQDAMADGDHTLEDVVEMAYCQAHTEDASGDKVSQGVLILKNNWKFGDQLQSWYKKTYNPPDSW